MLRKLTLVAALGLLLMLALTACASPEGSAGPVGPAGVAGPFGPQGPAGPAGEQGASGPSGADYVGSATCGNCHAELYAAFANSGHRWKLNRVENGQSPDYPYSKVPKPPEGYTWNDISYVIGGYNWKARFMDLQGYIIADRPGATVSDTAYLNQYNLPSVVLFQNADWVTYHSGEAQLKYDCGQCHTTGYRPSGHQDGLPGIVGTWAEPGVQCEACHGPGSLHANNPYGIRLRIDRASEACGQCHRRGDVTVVDAKGGFIQHHEQYEELRQSKHLVIDCVVCHDPHIGVIQLRQARQPTTLTQCADCHFQEAKYQKNQRHITQALDCIDCHMPRLIQSAWASPDRYTGDIRTHLMAIDPAQVGQFSNAGQTTYSQISLDYACRSCHVPKSSLAESDEALIEMATGYHTPPPATPEAEP